METETPTGESRLQEGCEVYRSGADQPLSEAVLTAIASESDLDTLELADEFGPLYDVIDPSALDSLFQSSGETEQCGGCVTFDYATYRVTVDQTGRVVLADQE